MNEIEQALLKCVAALEEQRDDPDHFSQSADDAIICGRRVLEKLAIQPKSVHNFYDAQGNVVQQIDASAEITMDYSMPSVWTGKKGQAL